ncbi:MAG: ComEC/Rec2 family competence protein [Parcubacteria group bacterium]|nr:ComEC/Rec2 family competence protein [Parcubacteria group bacterium]
MKYDLSWKRYLVIVLHMILSRSKIFLICLLAFIFGVGLGSFVNVAEKAALIIFLVLGILFLGVGLVDKSKSLWIFLLVIVFAGIVRFNIEKTNRAQFDGFIGVNFAVTVRGYINDQPQIFEDKQRFIFKAEQIIANDLVVSVADNILITSDLYPKYNFGDILEIEGEFQKPTSFDDFDYAAYLAKDDIYVLSYYPKIKKICEDKPNCLTHSFATTLKNDFFRIVFNWKQKFENSLNYSVNEPNASFLNGVILGSRSNIPIDLKEDFKKTGTSHIFAISGWNITIIGQIIGGFFLLFFRRPVAFWFTVGVIATFVLLTGASASVVRAAVMGVLVLLAYKEGRFYNATNAVVFAGALMILVNPKILRFDVGFQLSFLATLGLLYIGPVIERFFKRLPSLFKFKENLIATLSATVAILPLAIFYFRQFSIVSVPTNILVLPAIPWAMLFGFLSGILGLLFNPLGQAVGWTAWLFSFYALGIIKLFAKLSFAVFEVRWHWVVVFVYYVILSFVLRRNFKQI